MLVVKQPSSKEIQTQYLCAFANKLKKELVKPKDKSGKSELELRCGKDGGFGRIVGNRIIYYQPELN